MKSKIKGLATIFVVIASSALILPQQVFASNELIYSTTSAPSSVNFGNGATVSVRCTNNTNSSLTSNGLTVQSGSFPMSSDSFTTYLKPISSNAHQNGSSYTGSISNTGNGFFNMTFHNITLASKNNYVDYTVNFSSVGSSTKQTKFSLTFICNASNGSSSNGYVNININRPAPPAPPKTAPKPAPKPVSSTSSSSSKSNSSTSNTSSNPKSYPVISYPVVSYPGSQGLSNPTSYPANTTANQSASASTIATTGVIVGVVSAIFLVSLSIFAEIKFKFFSTLLSKLKK